MAIRVALHHRTHYRYDRRIVLSPHVVRLRPAPHTRTPLHSYSLRIAPEKHFLNWQQDPFGNHVARLVFPDRVPEFKVEVDVVADLVAINPFDFFLEADADQVPVRYDAGLALDLAPYLKVTEQGPLLDELVAALRRTGMRTVDHLVEINQALQRAIRYIVRLEPGVQAPQQTLALRSGSCRDSAWLLVQVLRRLGLAARFVSGYLIQLKPDVKPLEGPAGAAEDFSDLHAWAEVYLPGAGWVGLDPTSGLFAGEGHIPLACTPEPQSAAPIAGALEDCQVEFSFHMQVQRVHEVPRVTLPYREDQWAAIDRLGQRVDADLVAGDVRLSMGGEPTFVSMDDMEGAEWNTTALGPRKRALGGRLIRRLFDRFARGGLLHLGQGKWYPGESLPRWAFSCYWRKDGEPIWSDPALLADEATDYHATEEHARRFADTLAHVLGVEAKFVEAGYEDAWYYLWKERRLPTNVDPFDSNLQDEEERSRLARVFEQGLAKVIGYALPLHREGSGEGACWRSGPWFLRAERMYLVPGDSPMGYRLPLDSLPWVAPGDFPHLAEPDPLAPKAPLPARAQLRRMGPGPARVRAADARIEHLRREASTRQASAAWVVRTAVCVEPRHGRLHVFMPPTETLADYLDLVRHIEATAADLKLPVILEGYHPPHDDRLNGLKVTPDPGVIEVNVQPAHSWEELKANTLALYEEAGQCRLGTEKFMLDGRHSGTGGGNHMVLGGPTAADSPLLRRPDVLASLLTYWHNHPSLSYLFSGLFLGPTSQAPRVDEARNDSLYELEIALRQVAAAGGGAPWLVDRALRHILADLTGNTHRAEFCIDKLFSPDSASGRQGLVELRGFEMPPHPRMSLAQQLLVRALVAWFWREPCRQRLSRWGTELHDKYMLPHFVWQDFEDVLHDLRGTGYAFEGAWFAPHLEFRFPRHGQVVHRGVQVELRQALEPWLVLGEEPAGGGTARFVDSSVERVQVLVRNLTDARHVVTCNGWSLPLHPTGVAGEFVAGVRYRAWQPASALHPAIGVHTPLVFDVFDGWSRRSMGGCTYHVAHPGGRNHTTFPVNALEAEGRRAARFFAFGHTQGSFTASAPAVNREFPMTLDLRQATPA